MNTIAGRLAWIRGHEGLSYEDFAKRLFEDVAYEVAQPTVIGYLKGTTEKVPGDFLAAVAEVFDVDPGWLLTGDGSSETISETAEGLWYQLSHEVMYPLLSIPEIEARLGEALDLLQLRRYDDSLGPQIEGTIDGPRDVPLVDLIKELEDLVHIWEIWSRDTETEDVPIPRLSPSKLFVIKDCLEQLHGIETLPMKSLAIGVGEPIYVGRVSPIEVAAARYIDAFPGCDATLPALLEDYAKQAPTTSPASLERRTDP